MKGNVFFKGWTGHVKSNCCRTIWRFNGFHKRKLQLSEKSANQNKQPKQRGTSNPYLPICGGLRLSPCFVQIYLMMLQRACRLLQPVVYYQPDIKCADGGDNDCKPHHKQPHLQLLPVSINGRRPAYRAGMVVLAYLDPAFMTIDQGHILFLLKSGFISAGH